MSQTDGHGREYRKFIILTAPRNGSNLLSYLLHSHPKIVSIGEAFCVENIWGSPARPFLDANIFWKFYRNMSPALFLRTCIFQAYPKGADAVGFRIFYHHLDHFDSVREFLSRDRSICVIHLKRKNMLENLISLTIARKTGHWSSHALPKKVPGKIRLTYAECISHFRYLESAGKKYEREFSGHPMMTLYYEDLIDDLNAETGRVERFLGVSCRILTHPLIKQSAGPAPLVLENYTELKQRFSRTRWNTFFASR